MHGDKVARNLPTSLFALVVVTITLSVFAASLVVVVTGAPSPNFPSARNYSLNHPEQGSSAVPIALDAALNNHDSDAALALFSDSAVVSDLSDIACLPGPPPFCGGYNVFTSRVQIRGWLLQLIKDDIAVREIGSFTVAADNITWTLEVTVNEYRRLNVAPLAATAEAVVHGGKIDSLTMALTQESIAKLNQAYSTNQRTPFSVSAGGISLGVFVLGLVFPAAGIYYISRVKRLFATVPMLDKPWILLGAGVGALFVSLLIEALRDVTGMSANTADSLFVATLALCSFFVMSAMILMKRVMIGEPVE